MDEEHRRLTYAIVDGFTRYQGTAAVVTDATGCRLRWHVDLLPDERAEDVRALMEHGAAAMRAHTRELTDRSTRRKASHDADGGGPPRGRVAR